MAPSVKPRIAKKCEQCSRLFYVLESAASRKYCSHLCRGAASTQKARQGAMELRLKCRGCGCVIKISQMKERSRLYCSKTCYSHNRILTRPLKQITKECAFCHTKFTVYCYRSNRKYCSVGCLQQKRARLLDSSKKECLFCGKLIPLLQPCHLQKAKYCSHHCYSRHFSMLKKESHLSYEGK